MLPPWRGKSYGCDCRTSEGVRLTKREELTLTQIKAASDLLIPNKSYMSSDAFGRVVMAVAAVLAAQEARHKAELADARNFAEDAAKRYNDLLAEGRIVRCAFCAAEYPAGTAPSQHEALTAHVLVCPKHPMREAESKLREATERLSFIDLRETSALRCAESFPACAEWTAADWGNALAGEVGEACNKIKKLRRGEAIPYEDIADELADVVIYADLAAWFLGQSLEAAVVRKFNEVSARVGSDLTLAAIRSGPAPPPADCGGEGHAGCGICARCRAPEQETPK